MFAASFEPLAFLTRHGLTDARDLTVESLSGGYQNQVYRVRGRNLGRNLDWVVKRFSPSADVTLFPNLADAEAMALVRGCRTSREIAREDRPDRCRRISPSADDGRWYSGSR